MFSSRLCFLKPNGVVSGAPSGFSARVLGPTEVRLSWSAPLSQGVRPVWGYLIQRSIDGSSWSTVGVTTGTSAVVSGLVERQLYYFRVFAHILFVGNSPPASLTVTPRDLDGLWRSDAFDPVYSWR